MISFWHLLFIEPKRDATTVPVIDSTTRRMVAAFRLAKFVDPYYCGVHQCVCGASSAPFNLRLPNGRKVNTLCIHYLAHHRDEVPWFQIWQVNMLQFGEMEPSSMELAGIGYLNPEDSDAATEN
jgi:hypothetical protein